MKQHDETARHNPFAPARQTLAPQLILERYRPEEKVGAGGFGTVIKAWDTRIHRHVAIKCIQLSDLDARRIALPGAQEAPLISEEASGDLLKDASFMRSLAHIPGLDEARTAAMLTDSHIVTVYDFEVQGTMAYLIMEYVEGISLSQFLDEFDDEITLDVIAAFCEAIGTALQVAHSHHVLHLDIKPDNILIRRDGQIKVTDFGLATLADASGCATTGGGTIGYMPPEQINQKPLDIRSDEWAFASLLYRLLAGTNPFLTRSLDTAVSAIENAELVLPSLCWEGMSDDLDEVVFCALDPSSEERFETVEEFVSELRPFLGNAEEGVHDIAVLLGGVEEDEEEEESPLDDGLTEARRMLAERLTPRTRQVAAHAAGFIGSAFLSGCALWSIPWTSGGQNFLFWIPLIVIAILGAVRSSWGALVGYLTLSIALIVQGLFVPAAVLLLITIAWWYFSARADAVQANIGLFAPIAGMMYLNPVMPLVAGFALRPQNAMISAVFTTCIAFILGGCGSMSLFGWDVFRLINQGIAAGAFARGDLALWQPPAWCVMLSWVMASLILSLIRLRKGRTAAFVGVGVSSVVLFVGACFAAWFASGGLTAAPSDLILVSLVFSIAIAFICCFLVLPRSYVSQNLREDTNGEEISDE